MNDRLLTRNYYGLTPRKHAHAGVLATYKILSDFLGPFADEPDPCTLLFPPAASDHLDNQAGNVPPELSKVAFIKNAKSFDSRECDLPTRIALEVLYLHLQRVQIVIHSHDLCSSASQGGRRHGSNLRSIRRGHVSLPRVLEF